MVLRQVAVAGVVVTLVVGALLVQADNDVDDLRVKAQRLEVRLFSMESAARQLDKCIPELTRRIAFLERAINEGLTAVEFSYSDECALVLEPFR